MRDVNVLGLLDEQWGAAVSAVVAPEAGAEITPDDVRQAVRDRLAGYKVPKHVVFVGGHRVRPGRRATVGGAGRADPGHRSGSEVIHLAETGLCAHGEQTELITGGGTAVDGRLPVNTDGGCLAFGELIGASGLRQVHEVVRQLQGPAPGAQVPGAPDVGSPRCTEHPGSALAAVLIR